MNKYHMEVTVSSLLRLMYLEKQYVPATIYWIPPC